MRTILFLLTCVVACSFATGCSDDDCLSCPPPQSQEQPLAQFIRVEGYDNDQGSYFNVRIKILYSATSDTLANLVVDQSDQGSTFTLSPADRRFAGVAAMLTNGEDDRLSVSAMLDPGGAGSGATGNESNFLQGGFTGDMTPDLAGAEVTKILLHLDRLTMIRQGGTTSFTVGFRVVFMGKL
jgi:hypothetical protein